MKEKSPKRYTEYCDKRTPTPSKCSPTKLLSKYNRSPRNIMKEIKSKIEGNRVKNMVRKFEIGQIPSSPRSVKKREFGSLRKSEKKATPSKRKSSVLKNQPKINTFFEEKN